MIDPKVAGKILKEHFENVTPEEFKEWHDKYVLEGRDAIPPTADRHEAAKPLLRERGAPFIQITDCEQKPPDLG